MTVYFSDLDDFGRGIEIEMILKKYRLFFESSFTVDQVIYALHRHCEISSVIPKVSHIRAILAPEPPRISEAEYVQACKEYERGGYNPYTRAGEVKKAYEAQQTEKREQYAISNEKILAIAGNAVKRIGKM